MAVPKSACTHLSCYSHPQRLLVIRSHLLLLPVIACPDPHQVGLMAEREVEEMDLMFRQGYWVVILNCRSRHVQTGRTAQVKQP